MNFKSSFLLPVLFAGVVIPAFFASCDPDDVEGEVDKEKLRKDSITAVTKYVNKWILENMETYYYWNTNIPSTHNDTLSPDDFFESLLYKFNATSAPDGDRFSWIQEDYTELQDQLSGVTSNEIGFDYRLFRVSSENNDVWGQVTYVKKKTPAAQLGIKRGMWFNKIENTQITVSNYRTLTSFTKAQVNVTFLDEKYGTDGTFTGFAEMAAVSIPTVSNYAEDPVYMDSIYNIAQSKIGYIVYNFFAPDDGDDKYTYDKKLNSIFAKFKAAGINDLVLDLRYNSGGYSSSAQNLGSMIIPTSNLYKIFTYYRYNSVLQNYYSKQYGDDYFNTYFVDKIMNGSTVIEKINNVGLSRLYVLTGQYTASASEQLINGLKPYINVILIGDVTYGKNVASITMFEPNDPKNKWGMQPIVAKFFNSLGQSDFTAGFTPNYSVDDVGTTGIKQLGDIKEGLLNKALVAATGLSELRSKTQVDRKFQDFLPAFSTPGSIHRGLILDKTQYLK